MRQKAQRRKERGARHNSAPLEALQRAVDAVGNYQVLAKKLGISHQAVHKWLSVGMPAERVLAVEQITGVSRHELRPDIYPRESSSSPTRSAAAAG